MTEIPEHLLRRSRERRQALGLETSGADAPAAETTVEKGELVSAGEAAPATAAAAAPAAPAPAAAPAPPPPPKPLPPYVQAYHRRKRVPVWALPVLLFLPLWALIYAFTLEPPPLGESDPLALGASLYLANGCAQCHGDTGGGGVGPAFANGEVLLTFPDPAEQIAWIKGGADSAGPDGGYGDPNRPGGQHNVADLGGVMPPFPNLSDCELAELARHERETLGGADPEPELTDTACGAAEGG